MVAYRLDVAQALFPTGPVDGEVAGPTPIRLLFLGDSAASGYGVLNHGLALVSQSARYVAREHGIGCSWTAITDTELTAARAAAELGKATLDVDGVIVIVGPPDILRGTTSKEWSASFLDIVDTVQQGPRPECPVIFAAIPPMHRFQRMPNFAKRILRVQVRRLNQVTLALSNSHTGVSYSPFPRLNAFGGVIPATFTWSTIHSMWGRQLGATIADAVRPGMTTR